MLPKGSAFFLIAACLGVIPGTFYFAPTSRSVSFESLESRTDSGAPVFNQIGFVGGWSQDVWLMRQSHHGFTKSPERDWDRLAIVVDKTERPYRARFYEFRPGPLRLADASEAAPFKARCYACHAVGGIRNELKLEHLGIISFMVKSGLMPPFPFKMTDEERQSLEHWTSPSVPAGS